MSRPGRARAPLPVPAPWLDRDDPEALSPRSPLRPDRGLAAGDQAVDDGCLGPAQHELPSQFRLPGLIATIRKHYRLEARFGRIEVWRRATRPSTMDVSARPSTSSPPSSGSLA